MKVVGFVKGNISFSIIFLQKATVIKILTK